MPHETLQSETIVPPTLEANLDFLEGYLDRLEAEGSTGLSEYPAWWYEDSGELRSIKPQLKDESAHPANISRYYDLYSRQLGIQASYYGRVPSGHPMNQVIYDLGEDVVARGFRAEGSDGSLHTAILEDVTEHANDKVGTLGNEISFLREAYDLETATELLGIEGDDYNNKLRKQLLNNSPILSIRRIDEVPIENNFDADYRRGVRRDWMSKAVEAATGMPASEASDYVFSASRTTENIGERPHELKVLDAFDHFGVDRIRKIAAFSGIHGIEAYSIEQLERMENLADNSVEAAKQLSQHDVNVVMVNRFGDHNGVMNNVAEELDDKTSRTLFFEITEISDIYSHMVTLRKMDIKPSTLILAAHSAPGKFVVSDIRERDKTLNRHDIALVAGRKLVEMANANDQDEGIRHGYSMHGMNGMARLIDEYMQPSRAIDDDDSDIGRKKIIFDACDAASEVTINELDEDQEKIDFGLESVVSQLGKDLINSGVKTNVDIYGASAPLQMHRSEQGIYYSKLEGNDRVNVQAHRIRVENGRLAKQLADEVVLRKAA